jgi:hypothetical protein
MFFSLTMLTGCFDQSSTIQPEFTRLRAVQTVGTDWTYQEMYEYHLDGRIMKIQWERNTPYTTQGVEKYVYDNNLRLSGMIREMTGLVSEERRYKYSGAQIAEASSYYNGVKDSYTLYNYNLSGQLVKSEFYRWYPSATKFNKEEETHYSYHSHGNVHEILQFVFDSQQSQIVLHTTKTFPEYLLNRTAVVDSDPSLPTIRLQKNLPIGYVLKTPTTQSEVSFSYRSMPDGKLLDRTVNYPNGSTEQSVYTFYSEVSKATARYDVKSLHGIDLVKEIFTEDAFLKFNRTIDNSWKRIKDELKLDS